MKVLNQLIQHFWNRGALSEEQAHYLVAHGFVRAEDLENYVPLPAELTELAASDGEVTTAAPVEVLLSDEWDRQTVSLVEDRPAGRKGRGKRAAKPPVFDLDRLQAAVARALEEREDFLPALIEMGKRHRTCATWGEAPVALRQASPATFREALVRAAQARSAVLGEVWASVNAEPFHAMLDAPDARGPVARAFGRLLRATSAEELSKIGWGLKVAEVRAVANLLQVRRRLLAALVWMYDHRRVRLGRCLQRPARRPLGWDALAFGLVLVHNARAQRMNRTPSGYRLNRSADHPGLRDAWTTALALDPETVTPLFTLVFAGEREPAARDTTQEQPLPTIAIYCPKDWKV